MGSGVLGRGLSPPAPSSKVWVNGRVPPHRRSNPPRRTFSCADFHPGSHAKRRGRTPFSPPAPRSGLLPQTSPPGRPQGKGRPGVPPRPLRLRQATDGVLKPPEGPVLDAPAVAIRRRPGPSAPPPAGSRIGPEDLRLTGRPQTPSPKLR